MQSKWTKRRLIAFESKVAKMFLDGRINCPIHLSGGNEDELIKIFESIKKNDWIVSTHRNHYHYLLKGGDERALLAELRGTCGGPCGGNGRSMHLYDMSRRFITSGIVAGGCSIACGLGLGITLRKGPEGRNDRVWCFVGDGAEDSGHYLEAVRYCESMGLPVTFVVEDNDMSIESSKDDRWGTWMPPVCYSNVVRYGYKRVYPHVGVGKHVTF